ncbi:hypothetical protein D3C76_1651910 [compost metagenome]
MPDFLSSPRPVHIRRLIQLPVDAGQRRQINNRPPSGALPDPRPQINHQPGMFVGQERNGVEAHCGDHIVDQTAVGGEHLVYQTADNDP